MNFKNFKNLKNLNEMTVMKRVYIKPGIEVIELATENALNQSKVEPEDVKTIGFEEVDQI